MLDPAILTSLEALPPPKLPTLAIEREWRTPAGDRLAEAGRRAADSFEAEVSRWQESIDQVKEVAVAYTAEPATSEELEQLSAIIAKFETLSEARAKETQRNAKHLARLVKQTFRTDPAVAAAYRSVGQRLIDLDKRLIGAALDYALFLRAIRAEADPRSRGGPVFDDPDALAAYLAGPAAA